MKSGTYKIIPEDSPRLRELVNEAAIAVDAASEAGLLSLELDLENRIRALLHALPDVKK